MTNGFDDMEFYDKIYENKWHQDNGFTKAEKRVINRRRKHLKNKSNQIEKQRKIIEARENCGDLYCKKITCGSKSCRKYWEIVYSTYF